MDRDDASRDIGAPPLTFRILEPHLTRVLRARIELMRRVYSGNPLPRMELTALTWNIHQAVIALDEAYAALDKQDREQGDPA